MCKGCAAHKAHINSLEKQLDYFREQLSPRPYSRATPDMFINDAPVTSPPVFEELPWVSEEEEELLAMKQSGIDVDQAAIQRALEQIGAMSTQIISEP